MFSPQWSGCEAPCDEHGDRSEHQGHDDPGWAFDADRAPPGAEDHRACFATDFNEHRGTQTVEEGAEAIVRYALIAVDGPTGGFFDRDGAEPW